MTDLKKDVQPYPNPTTDQLYVSGLEGKLPYFIVDASGRTMQQGLFNTAQGITTKTLPSGVYFLHVGNEKSPILFIKH